MKIVVFLFLSIVCIFANTIDNGKAFFYTFDRIKNPLIKMDNKEFQILAHPTKKDKFFTIIPINYKTKDKVKNIAIYSNFNIYKTLSLDITKGKYKKEYLSVSKKHVNPFKKVREQIKKEFREATKIYNTISDYNHIKSKFELPMDSKITSAFGNARVFNKELKSYHSGTDFRAKVGTPCKGYK